MADESVPLVPPPADAEQECLLSDGIDFPFEFLLSDFEMSPSSWDMVRSSSDNSRHVHGISATPSADAAQLDQPIESPGTRATGLHSDSNGDASQSNLSDQENVPTGIGVATRLPYSVIPLETSSPPTDLPVDQQSVRRIARDPSAGEGDWTRVLAETESILQNYTVPISPAAPSSVVEPANANRFPRLAPRPQEAAPATSSYVPCFPVTSQLKRPPKRKQNSEAGREKSRRVREVGACIRCKKYKENVSRNLLASATY